MLHKASQEQDETARGVLESDGPIAQREWRCPFVTRQEPSRDGLDESKIEALGAVERLTGAKCDTCPGYYARLPWVRDGVAARRWRDKGQLQLRVGDYPSAALVAAIDAIDRGDNARQADDWERREREREAERERMERERRGG